MYNKIHFPHSVLVCSFCTELNLSVCASFPVFSVNFEGDKLSPWPVFFFKGQFGLQCGIGAMVQPGSNPAIIACLFLKVLYSIITFKY